MWRQEIKNGVGGGGEHLLGINRADIQHLEHARSIQLLLIHSCNRSPAKYIILDFALNTSLPFAHSFSRTFSSLFVVRYGISPHSLSQRAWGVIVLCWNRWCFIGPASHTAFDMAVRKALCVLAELFHCNAPDDSYYCAAVFLANCKWRLTSDQRWTRLNRR